MKNKAFLLLLIILFIGLAIIFWKKIPFVDAIYQSYRIDRIQNGLKNNPYSEKLHYEISQIYYKMAEFEKYENQLEILRRISPDVYLYAEELGDHFFKTGDYEKALKYFNEALKLFKGEENLLYFKIGNSHVNLGENEKAIEAYDNQIKILKELNNEKSKRMIQFIVQIKKSLEGKTL